MNFDILEKILDEETFNKSKSLNLNIHDSPSEISTVIRDTQAISKSINSLMIQLSSFTDNVNSLKEMMEPIKAEVFEIEENKLEVEVRKKNLANIANIMTDMVENLKIREADDVNLNEFERILKYKLDPHLEEMSCVKNQKNLAEQRKREYYCWLIQEKRTFDSFMQQLLQDVRAKKSHKRSKSGVLSIVKEFEQFATQVEAAKENAGDRRINIDRYYLELLPEIFETIDKLESAKTPSEMIRLENYYYLLNILRSIKVPCLENQSKEARLKYKEALASYVARYFGRPLEKLNVFFEGVQAKIAQGVKEDEISFQLAFSKQELRKVLQSVNMKDVKRGLEDMYRKIEKHASDIESNLIQVIWHAMQDEFLSQYKIIQTMIERCYPSSDLYLSFSIEDVLRVFSDIAQSH